MERISTLLPAGGGDTMDHHGARRRSRRFTLNADVRFIEPVDSRGVCLNASTGGLRVAVDEEVPVGELCIMEVRFTEERVGVEHARVVWSRRQPDGWILGLEFVGLH